MKHRLVAVTVITSMLLAGSAWAATYGWTGTGGDNLWSNGNNWTNVADGSIGTAPGAADTAQFAQYENDAVAINANTTVSNLVLGTGGMSITGAYTLTLNAATEYLGFGSYIGGSATIDCNLNVANAGNSKIVNFNNVLTINGNVSFPANDTGFQLDAWGASGVATFNGQVTGYSGSQGNRSFFGNNSGTVALGAQHNPWRNTMCRLGTLILKGNYDAPNGDNNRVGFPSGDGNNPKRIWIQAQDGLGIYSNRWNFSPRSADTKYHEFRVMAPTVHAKLHGRVRIDDKLWWCVDSGCYVEIVDTGIERGDSAVFTNVYMYGGGTTDVKVAQIGTFPIPFVLSNGVFLVNNPSGYATHGPVTVCAGGVFGGAGSIGGTVICESGGIVSPGNSIGTLSPSNATFAAGGILHWEVNHPNADTLAVANVLDISAGAVTVKVVNAGSIQAGTTYEAFSFATLNGNAANDLVVDVSGVPGITANIIPGSGSIGIQLVPEPGVIGVAVLALVALRRRK